MSIFGCFVLAFVSLCEGAAVYYTSLWIGFPEGQKNGLERLQKVTFPTFAVVAVVFALVALLAARKLYRGEFAGQRAWLKLFGVWVLLNALAFGVDFACEKIRPPLDEVGWRLGSGRPAPETT